MLYFYRIYFSHAMCVCVWMILIVTETYTAPPRQKDPTDILAKMSYYLREVKSSNSYDMNVKIEQNLTY